MSNNLDTSQHRKTIGILGDHQWDKGKVDEKLAEFLETYLEFLKQFIAAKLERPDSDPEVEAWVRQFLGEEFEKVRKGHRNVVSQWDKQGRFGE